VPAVLADALDEFENVFGRRPLAALSAEQTDDADVVLVASGTRAGTARRVVQTARRAGERVGLISMKLFRPFPRHELVEAIPSSTQVATDARGPRRIGVLDRNHSPGSGGIFWQEVAATLRGRPDLIVQNYVLGLGGGDVTPGLIHTLIEDLRERQCEAPPVLQEVVV
jgi:pyruvate/2-oxoacid:ferredoxin oxidoreductase alpha subunit